MLKMNNNFTAPDYRFGTEKPHSNAYLSGPILAYLKRIGARKVLDLGCGNGALASDLTEQGMEVVGIDPSESGIENCRKAVPTGKFYCMGIYDDPDTVSELDFDAAICTEVVEHLFYPRELPRFARKKLKEGAPLMVTTPYHGYYKNLALSIANKWDRHHTALWDGGHIKFWSRRTLGELLESEGFASEQFIGCGRFPFFWKSMLIIANKTVQTPDAYMRDS